MKIFLGIVGLLTILGAIFAAVFLFGGFFNVAASQMDSDIVNRMLENMPEASVARHASDQPPASLENAAMVQAAFVKKLPNVSEDDYKAWTAAPAAKP
jgi:hypothetical protein